MEEAVAEEMKTSEEPVGDRDRSDNAAKPDPRQYHSGHFDNESHSNGNPEKPATGKKKMADGYRSNKSSAKVEESYEEEDSRDGALAFVFYRNKKTGEVEYLFEQPKGQGENAGRIKLIGGHKKVRESNLEAMLREAGEEVEAPAIDVLLKGAFEYYMPMTDVVNKEITITSIYMREIESEADWEIMKTAREKHDAGNFRIFTDSALLNLDNRYFAYGWADMIKGVIRLNSGESINAGYLKEFKPAVPKTQDHLANYRANSLAPAAKIDYPHFN